MSFAPGELVQYKYGPDPRYRKIGVVLETFTYTDHPLLNECRVLTDKGDTLYILFHRMKLVT